MIFIEQFLECNSCVGLIFYLLDDVAERVLCNNVPVSFKLICKIHIGSINMPTYLEIDYIHVGEVLIYHQSIALDTYILFVDIFDFRQRFFSDRIASMNLFR